MTFFNSFVQVGGNSPDNGGASRPQEARRGPRLCLTGRRRASGVASRPKRAEFRELHCCRRRCCLRRRQSGAGCYFLRIRGPLKFRNSHLISKTLSAKDKSQKIGAFSKSFVTALNGFSFYFRAGLRGRKLTNVVPKQLIPLYGISSLC